MTPRAVLLLGIVATTLGAACSSAPSSAPEATASRLEGGIVARVGPLDVPASLVPAIAAAQDLSLAAARDHAIRDALFALGARARDLDATADARAAIRARLARARLAAIATEARTGPPTDAEVEQGSAAHFLDLDRPEGFRVIHAVAMFPKHADAAAKQRAHAVAERIAKAVAAAPDADTFRSRAEAVPHDGIELRVESLDPVAADGRVLAPGGGAYEIPFALAASRLANVGDESPLVETSFGYHVLMLLERTAAHRVPFEERRRMLASEIVTVRERRATSKLLDELRAARPVSVERSADALLASVPVSAP